jgi:hypothetical protein
MRPIFLAGALVSFLSTTGCIVLPFVAPPVKASIGGRAYLPNLPKGDSGAFSVQIGVNPLQFVPKQLGRRFDFGLGYIGNGSDHYHFDGGYLELTAFPLLEKLPTGVYVRGSISLEPTAFLDSRGIPGAGAGGKLGFEFAGVTDGPLDSSGPKGGAVGYAFGEGGLGLYLEGFGARVFDHSLAGGTTYFSIGGGLSVRLPSAVGIVWAMK